MSNRDMCISVINSMEEWQLQSVLEMLNAVKGTMDKLEQARWRRRGSCLTRKWRQS